MTSIILYYTGASRSSTSIFDEKKRNTSSGNQIVMEAMQRIKQSSIDMKLTLLKGNVSTFAEILGKAWEDKKKMISVISNTMIHEVFDVALEAGVLVGKVSKVGVAVLLCLL